MMNNYYAIKFSEESFSYLDQTKLPLQEVYIKTDDYERIATAIERLELRGAPLILFAVSASDDSVVTAEDNEIRRITQELKIPHAEFVAARAAVRDRLAVLRREPRPAPTG